MPKGRSQGCDLYKIILFINPWDTVAAKLRVFAYPIFYIFRGSYNYQD